MRGRVRDKIQTAKKQPKRSYEASPNLTLARKQEAIREARKWGENRGEYCRGLGSWCA